MNRRTKITYRQLDKALRSLGFSRRVFETHAKGVRYDHKDTGAMFTLPLYPAGDRVLDHHLMKVRAMLDGFGVAEPSVFEAKLKKVG